MRLASITDASHGTKKAKAASQPPQSTKSGVRASALHETAAALYRPLVSPCLPKPLPGGSRRAYVAYFLAGRVGLTNCYRVSYVPGMLIAKLMGCWRDGPRAWRALIHLSECGRANLSKAARPR